jgi:anti-sigma regulatory factor (Ser/Thr protein kinase)
MNPPTATTARPDASRSRRARLRAWRSLALTVPGDRPELLAVVRRLVQAHALDCGAGTAKAEEIELCASELLTNALRYSDGPARLELAVHDGEVRLAVSDTSTHAPDTLGTGPSANSENGRGLQIVNKLADTVEVRVHPWGKTVATAFDLT